MLDLLLIEGGTAGLIASGMAAGLGARVALVERAATGGDCLWTGCVPSKALIEAANLRHAMRHADRLGLTSVTPHVDLSRVMVRIRRGHRRTDRRVLHPRRRSPRASGRRDGRRSSGR